MLRPARRPPLNQTDENFEEMFEESSKNENPTQPVMSRRKIVSILVAGTLVAGAAAAGYTFGIEPLFEKKAAEKTLEDVVANHGAIRGYNTSSVEFKGEGPAPATSTSNQKSLSVGSTATNPAAFVFTNGKSTSGTPVDVYLDFSAQRSRDFIVLNNAALRNLVESGEIQLRIHPVPTNSKFSVYSAEAFAEVFEKSPDRAWSYLLELMKASVVLDQSPTGTQEDEVLSAVVGSAAKVGINGVTSFTVKSGAFASWILTVADDPKVQNQFGLPAIYKNDELVDQDSVDINNPDTLTKHLKTKVG
jgi:hypothetical protein